MDSREQTALMIAFHFPPASMGSGHLRTLGFVKYMPALGWSPVVLSAHPRAYPSVDIANNALIPQACPVYRTFALDSRRHLGIRGKYPSILALPDRWVSWWPAAVLRGLHLIRSHKIRVIWSTYPIMTAHCIAYTLSRLTGLPWVADFRDPVATSISTKNLLTVAIQMRWETRVLSRATKVVFATLGAMQSYVERYPHSFREGKMSVITNGYDETEFMGFAGSVSHQIGRPLRLVHSGVLYPSGRDPIPFFRALANLKASGAVSANDVVITLRASGSEVIYAAEIQRLGLADIVTLAPSISYREALAEQAAADALLLFQGAQYDRQIPAKVYEYLRISRPIFALVSESGDTATVLRGAGGAEIVSPDDVHEIEQRFLEFIHMLQRGKSARPNESVVRKYSRRYGASQLVRILDQSISP